MTDLSLHPLHPFARAAALVAGLAFASMAPVAAEAAAPMAKTSAPGYFRMMLGDFEITALSDGTVDLPVEQLLKHDPAKVQKALAKSFLKTPLETSVNAYLVNTGSKLVLIDAGAGALFGPTLGKLAANLKASGYQPEQVDEIYVTHMHPDHVGGLSAGSALVFPNAKVRADKRDSDFWLSQVNLDKAPEASKGFFQGAMASLNPYVAANKYDAFSSSMELVPGVRAVSTYGHTAGHTSYVVESQGHKLVLVGDLIHVGAVQFDDPTVTIAFDGDARAAMLARARVFAQAAKDHAIIGASHIQFPGLGHLRSVGKGYQWVPVNYTQMR
jgi:glyoxylase-like metal-dependent hydrolase (beta-lactamase superfamily II)